MLFVTIEHNVPENDEVPTNSTQQIFRKYLIDKVQQDMDYLLEMLPDCGKNSAKIKEISLTKLQILKFQIRPIPHFI